MTKGLAAGPYGDPARFDPAPVENMTFMDAIGGSYERYVHDDNLLDDDELDNDVCDDDDDVGCVYFRAISMFRTSYSIVNQARAALPREVGARVWFSQYAPASSSYIPLYVSAHAIPKPYTRFVM